MRVGSKPFSESMIPAEMIAQVAEDEGITVPRNIPTGPPGAWRPVVRWWDRFTLRFQARIEPGGGGEIHLSLIKSRRLP